MICIEIQVGVSDVDIKLLMLRYLSKTLGGFLTFVLLC